MLTAVLSVAAALAAVALGSYLERIREQGRWQRDTRLRVYSNFLPAFKDFIAVAPLLAEIEKEIDALDEVDSDNESDSQLQYEKFLLEQAMEKRQTWSPFNTAYSELTLLGSPEVRWFGDAMFIAAAHRLPGNEDRPFVESLDPFQGLEFDDDAIAALLVGFVMAARTDLGLDRTGRRLWPRTFNRWSRGSRS